MNDKSSENLAGGQSLLNSEQQSQSVDRPATLKLEEFFANLIPDPVDNKLHNHMESDDFFAQLLASSISQEIENYQHKLESAALSNTSTKALQASSLVGRSVLIESGEFYLESGLEIPGRLKLDDKSHHIFVYVENEDEDIVRIIPLGDSEAGDLGFIWNGQTRTGEMAEDGVYRFIVSCISKGRVMELKAMTYNKVVRAAYEYSKDEIWLYFENDQMMNMVDVIEILRDV